MLLNNNRRRRWPFFLCSNGGMQFCNSDQSSNQNNSYNDGSRPGFEITVIGDGGWAQEERQNSVAPLPLKPVEVSRVTITSNECLWGRCFVKILCDRWIHEHHFINWCPRAPPTKAFGRYTELLLRKPVPTNSYLVITSPAVLCMCSYQCLTLYSYFLLL